MKLKILSSIVFFLVLESLYSQNVNIYSDFPTGNILIEKIKNDSIWVRPDLRDTEGDWFYWCFAVDNAKGKTLSFLLPNLNKLTAKGPAVSYDSGYTWEWLFPDTLSFRSESFQFSFESNKEVRFSMGMPYSQSRFQTFIEKYSSNPSLSLDTLTLTEENRPIEKVIIRPKNKAEYKVLITARHHACEMMANYVIEGMIDEILMNKKLGSNIEYCFIPFIDIDGVENGDQGKNRLPRDHNRDYSGEAVYNSTIKLKEWFPEWSQNMTTICIDIHCPWIRGDGNEHIYLPGSQFSEMAEEQSKFSRHLTQTNSGELKVSNNLIYPFGYGWNTHQNNSKGFSFSKWVSTFEHVKLGTSIEFPYGVNVKQTITQQNASNFGRDFIKAVNEYLYNE
ncbi:MAG: hypothetical protein PETM_00590 [Petrimonas sp.]|uniref:M14 family zinc carboxypeptidase n=1 Tax=Petrimonas sp. TaxID=2023866 RepID=UPI0030D14844